MAAVLDTVRAALATVPAGLTSLLLVALHVAVVVRAVTRPQRTPAARVAWVAVVLLLPVLGVLAYLVLGETSIGRLRARRLADAQARLKAAARASSAGAPAIGPAGPDALASLMARGFVRDADPGSPSSVDDRALLDARASTLFDFGCSINGFPPVGGNRIALLGDAGAPPDEPMRDSDRAIDVLVADIEAAREHVHLGFYIWLDDRNGARVADAVCAAARRGVACRVMVDALGSRRFARSAHWHAMRAAGARVVTTLDDIPRLGDLAVGRLDLRNHRKLAVIDNRIAYCGSQNCADPEFRVAARYAPWIDVLLRCEGPIVRQAQTLFLETWIAETGDALEGLPQAAPEPEWFEPGAAALMFGTGPTRDGAAMSDMFVAMCYAAHVELIITTPYFVPDEALLRALCAAPRRGVATTLLLPARNNSRLVALASHSAYPALLEAGVALLEYPLGLLHTKSITVDGALALVGSANMDRRSLQLNFENNLLVADRAVTAAIRQRQAGYLAVSRPVSADAVRAWPLYLRLIQNAVGMMSPVL